MASIPANIMSGLSQNTSPSQAQPAPRRGSIPTRREPRPAPLPTARSAAGRNLGASAKTSSLPSGGVGGDGGDVPFAFVTQPSTFIASGNMRAAPEKMPKVHANGDTHPTPSQGAPPTPSCNIAPPPRPNGHVPPHASQIRHALNAPKMAVPPAALPVASAPRRELHQVPGVINDDVLQLAADAERLASIVRRQRQEALAAPRPQGEPPLSTRPQIRQKAPPSLWAGHSAAAKQVGTASLAVNALKSQAESAAERKQRDSLREFSNELEIEPHLGRGASSGSSFEPASPQDSQRDWLARQEAMMDESGTADMKAEDEHPKILRSDTSGISVHSKIAEPLMKLKKLDGTPAPWGSLRFPGAGTQRTPAKWCAMAPDSDTKDIVGLLMNTWQLPAPDVIISVTGSATGDVTTLSEEQRDIFKQGLLDAVNKTHAWVVTGGTSSGVMGLVGKMMAEQSSDEHTNVCLGIATMGVIKNHEDFVGKTGKIHKYDPADVAIEKERTRSREAGSLQRGRSACQMPVNNLAKKLRLNAPASPPAAARVGSRAPLDPYHTHFLLVDAGAGNEGQYGHEIQLRANVEDRLCQEISTSDETNGHCLMILVVVGGGPGTLKTVLAVLEKERPVVVLANSGGCARDIYDYIEHGWLPQNQVKADPDQPGGGKLYARRKTYCEDLATTLLPKINQAGSRRSGLYNNRLLTFFGAEDFNADTDGSNVVQTGFDRFLMKAILSNVKLATEALIHAVTWGDPGILRHHLEDLVDQIEQDGADMTLALLEALVSCARDRTERTRECVQLLIDFGCSVRDLDFDTLFSPLLMLHPLPLRELAVRHENRLRGSTGLYGNVEQLASAVGLTGAAVTVGFANNASASTGVVSSRASTCMKKRKKGRLHTAHSGDSITGECSTVDELTVPPSNGVKDTASRTRRLRDRIRRRGARAQKKAAEAALHAASASRDAATGVVLQMSASRDSDTLSRLETFSFFVLESLIDQSDYKAHIRARAALGKEEVTWVDIMMWSVLGGHFELSRIIWLKTSCPLRCAIIARRLCLKLVASQSTAVGEQLKAAAEMYEDWAVGVLDQVEDVADAIDLLTCTPARRDPKTSKDEISMHAVNLQWIRGKDQSSWISLWTESVLDEAAKVPNPCRKFLAHRHCQELLKQYFAGHYRGSPAAIDVDTTIFQIVSNCAVHLLNGPLCGVLPSMEVKRPAFPKLLTDDEEDEDDNDNEIDELEAKIFGSGLLEDARRRTCCFSFAQWGSYWSIPKVKFTLHAILNFVTLVDLSLWLCLPRTTALDVFSAHEVFELIFWCCYLGRCLEEYTQMRLSGPHDYFSNFWNLVDAALFVFNSCALVLRLIVGTYFLAYFPCFSWELSEGCLLNYNLTVQQTEALSKAVAWAISLDALGHDFQTIGMILLFFRYLEIVTYHHKMSETVVILIEMVNDSKHVLAIMMFVIAVTGLAMISSFKDNSSMNLFVKALREADVESRTRSGMDIPEVAAFEKVGPEDELGNWQQTWAFGVWAVLGEFENSLQFIYDYHAYRDKEMLAMGLDPSLVAYFDWLPLLLWSSTFLMTVFLVNLMIARMTSTYEKVQNESHWYRAKQAVALTAEFKDERGHAPPFNIPPFLLGCFWTSRAAKADTGYTTLMGKSATLRLESRERALSAKFNAADLHRERNTLDAQIALVRAKTTTLETLARQMTRMQSDMKVSLVEMKEQQTAMMKRIEDLAGSDA